MSRRYPTDLEIRQLWKRAGGSFFGPHVEHASMKFDDFRAFMSAVMVALGPFADVADWLDRIRETNHGLTFDGFVRAYSAGQTLGYDRISEEDLERARLVLTAGRTP